ncbi:hypothetical protein CWO91_37310 [Bradyrhizobium genosp. SA-3]|uniref:hypothetical protein n=1 Tax=Bradyrhizobium genosp. SA-3 TaxID=508868 RepID=UPI00102968C4|nr:hypothetical protein [Bradyrhizobium genosp. SA-3]RZM98037.1 hypothetical protein CWO91_37310 [Bradyrhizobium genosp. SA-3]
MRRLLDLLGWIDAAPYTALAPMIGANVSVRLEDNLYLSRGKAELLQEAVEILGRVGVRVIGPGATSSSSKSVLKTSKLMPDKSNTAVKLPRTADGWSGT